MTDNFKQALKEVFTPNKPKAGDEPDNPAVAADKPQDLSESKVDGAKEPDKGKKAVSNQTDTKKNSSGHPNPKDSSGSHKNVITKDTKITGTISTQSDLEISGVVEGDIESKGSVFATGNVKGKITCKSAEIDSAVIEGDLNVKEGLVIKVGSQINGMLSAKSIQVSGMVTGDVMASSAVKVDSDACIVGNITTPSITVESGAILNGKIEVQRDKVSGK